MTNEKPCCEHGVEIGKTCAFGVCASNNCIAIKPPQSQESANYMQVEKPIACGHCMPGEYGAGLKEMLRVNPDYKCDCKCHQSQEKPSWVERFANLLVEHDDIVTGWVIPAHEAEEFIRAQREQARREGRNEAVRYIVARLQCATADGGPPSHTDAGCSGCSLYGWLDDVLEAARGTASPIKTAE